MEADIKVSKYIIHYLEKEAKKTVATVDFSKHVLAVDDFSVRLISEIHKAYNESTTLKNTHFKEDEKNRFYNTLIDYLAEGVEENFYEFSKSLDQLKEKIEKESLAVGGYYLFADYEILGKRYILVTLLRKKSGLNISKVGDIFKLNSSENLNIDKIAMGFRLNLQIFSNSEDTRNYLAIITTQQNGEVSGYFKDWVLAGGLIPTSKNTSEFVKLIKSAEIPKDDDGNDLYNRDEFQKIIYSHVDGRKDKMVNLIDIATYLYGEEKRNYFLEMAQENNLIIDAEFKRASKEWKGLITIKAKVPGIEVNVSYDKINPEEVELKDDFVIIHSKAIFDQISKQYDRNTAGG